MGEKKISLLNFLIEINYQEIFHTNNKVKKCFNYNKLSFIMMHLLKELRLVFK